MKPFGIRLILLLVLASTFALGEEAWQEHVGPDRFRSICIELAGRVDLFQKIWATDPAARVFGGTSRDFIWFVRRELSKAKTASQVKAVLHGLRARTIEAAEFLGHASDIDVVSTVKTEGYDVTPPENYVASSAMGREEKLRGYMPVDKILLGKSAAESPPWMDRGDGILEIYRARPTIQYAERFAESAKFQAREYHPILLGLRLVRQTAVAYFSTHGHAHPDSAELLATIDPASRAYAAGVFAALRASPDTLEPFAGNRFFRYRLNQGLARVFAGYTNPTAGRELMKLFGVDAAIAPHGRASEPYYNQLYAAPEKAGTLPPSRATVDSFAELTGADIVTPLVSDSSPSYYVIRNRAAIAGCMGAVSALAE